MSRRPTPPSAGRRTSREDNDLRYLELLYELEAIGRDIARIHQARKKRAERREAALTPAAPPPGGHPARPACPAAPGAPYLRLVVSNDR